MEVKERTLYCGNLSDRVTEDLLYELFLQAGPLENVTIPKEKDGRRKAFGFIAFKHAVSVQYAIALMNGIPLYGKRLTLNPRSDTNEKNPYLQQLQEYFDAKRNFQNSSQGYYQQADPGCYQRNDQGYQHNDNRYHQSDNRYLDSRRNEPRTDSRIHTPVIYPTYQPFLQMVPQILPPPIPSYAYPLPARYDNYKNVHSHYRR